MHTGLEQTSLGKPVAYMLNVKCNFKCNFNFKLIVIELSVSNQHSANDIANRSKPSATYSSTRGESLSRRSNGVRHDKGR